jgi:hypothetical protein
MTRKDAKQLIDRYQRLGHEIDGLYAQLVDHEGERGFA